MAARKKPDVQIEIPNGLEARIVHAIRREMALAGGVRDVQTWEFLLPRDRAALSEQIKPGASINLKPAK